MSEPQNVTTGENLYDEVLNKKAMFEGGKADNSLGVTAVKETEAAMLAEAAASRSKSNAAWAGEQETLEKGEGASMSSWKTMGPKKGGSIADLLKAHNTAVEHSAPGFTTAAPAAAE